MISVLFLIAGTHSITNLQTYKQAKIFFNSTYKQYSEEPLKEKRKTFIGIFPFHLVQYANTEFMSLMT